MRQVSKRRISGSRCSTDFCLAFFVSFTRILPNWVGSLSVGVAVRVERKLPTCLDSVTAQREAFTRLVLQRALCTFYTSIALNGLFLLSVCLGARLVISVGQQQLRRLVRASIGHSLFLIKFYIYPALRPVGACNQGLVCLMMCNRSPGLGLGRC